MSSTSQTTQIQPQEVEKRLVSPMQAMQVQPSGSAKTQFQQYESLHQELVQVAQRMAQTLPAGRETSLAIQKIEEAEHWAFKSIAVESYTSS